MSRRRGLSVLVMFIAILGMLMTASPAVAEDENPLSGFPYGKYVGSAVGSAEGSRPFQVTLYLDAPRWGQDDGQVEITARTPAFPIPIPVKGTPTKVAGGWDIAVNVSIGGGTVPGTTTKIPQLTGSGIIRVRERDGVMTLYGNGSGGLDGKSGSGYASGSRVGESSLADQIGGALTDFLGGPPTDDSESTSTETTSTVPMPEEWSDPGDTSTSDPDDTSIASPATDTDAGSASVPVTDRPPLALGEAAFILIYVFLYLLLLVIGII